MTFFRFAITFRHKMGENMHQLDSMNQFFFANQIFRDKKFPKHSNDYAEVSHYVFENYSEDIVEGFKIIWTKYQIAKKSTKLNKSM